MSYSFLKRCASTCALATLAISAGALVPIAGAQEPSSEPAAPAAGPASEARTPGMPPKKRAISRPRAGVPPSVGSPHGVRSAGPRIMPAPDLAKGEIEVRVAAKGLDSVENQQVTLAVSKQSIERGNIDSTLTALTDASGVARFPGQGTETEYVYTATITVGGARYSTNQFQFRDAEAGLRVIVPIYASTSELEGLLLLSRTAIAIIPQDNLFAIDVMWRIENFGEVSWLPENIVFPLPEGFEALNIRNPKAEARFEPAGDAGVKLAGTFAPGQHDLMFRFHLRTEGKSERSFSFPTTLNVGTVRVIMDSAPTMELKVDGFPEPDETRNAEGQRRLISGRDFLSEKTRAPEKVLISISGIPTPPAGRSVAVGLAALITLAGFAQAAGRRSAKAPRSNLSSEERERAGELLLEELISLEQAFRQGVIGRKTHEQARRQLLEAFARLGAGLEVSPTKPEASGESAPAGA